MEGRQRRSQRECTLADSIEASKRQLFGGGTSISGAIDYSRMLLGAGPFRGIRRVIDISGDGANNRGRAVTLARDEAVRDGISINGLPILALEPDLDRYYYDYVIGGPGAFMVPAKNYDTFADAILKKLIIEIADVRISAAMRLNRHRPQLNTTECIPAASHRFPTAFGRGGRTTGDRQQTQ